jgi:hypothetical protein
MRFPRVRLTVRRMMAIVALVGVALALADGAWELRWFGPGDLEGPSVLRYIVGGGTAEVRLPDESRATSPTPEFLKQVGLPDRPDTP